jgi:hypothetical protein
MKPRLFKTKAGFDAFVERYAKAGVAFHVTYMHDRGCAPSHCTCNPWREVREMTPEAVLEGVAKEQQWIKESSS